MVEIYDQQLTQIKEAGRHEYDDSQDNEDDKAKNAKNMTPDEIIQEKRKLLKNNED